MVWNGNLKKIEVLKKTSKRGCLIPAMQLLWCCNVSFAIIFHQMARLVIKKKINREHLFPTNIHNNICMYRVQGITQRSVLCAFECKTTKNIDRVREWKKVSSFEFFSSNFPSWYGISYRRSFVISPLGPWSCNSKQFSKRRKLRRSSVMQLTQC